MTESLPEVAIPQGRYTGNNVAEARAYQANFCPAARQEMNKKFSVRSDVPSYFHGQRWDIPDSKGVEV